MERLGGFIVTLITVFLLAGCGAEQDVGSESGQGAARPEASAEAPLPDVNDLLASADIKRGKTLFLQCRACHSLQDGGAHKVGPNLYGMFGREAGAAPGFTYSDAVVNSGIIWDAASMDQWLARPSDYLPGNRMVFVGIKKPQDRANLIAFLQQETGAGQ